jgi:hypothetical protein
MLFMISVGGAYLYVQWLEKKQQDEADRRRREMYARQRAYYDKRNRGPVGQEAAAMPAGKPVETPPSTLADEATASRPDATARRKIRFRFSLRQLLTAMVSAAIIFGFVRFLGGPANTATMLGFIALAGLVIHAAGFEPPEIVILGWWLILVLYVLLSIVAAAWSGFA